MVGTSTHRKVTYIDLAVPTLSDSTGVYTCNRPKNYTNIKKTCIENGTFLAGFYYSHPGYNIIPSEIDKTRIQNYNNES